MPLPRNGHLLNRFNMRFQAKAKGVFVIPTPKFDIESDSTVSESASESGGSMKNKEISNSCSVAIGTNKDFMDDDAHLKVTYSPGKKGGNFGLPNGGKLILPEGLFGKKDTITCQVASPSQRWKYYPTLPSYEHITSEIYTLQSTMHPLKKSVIIQIPYYQIETEHNEINVKGKWSDENEWVDVGFLKKEDCFVELEVDRLGIFIVTFTPKKEIFDVTPQGCLYNAHISRYISVRFPKKAHDKPFQCAIQINPIPSDKLQLAKELSPGETADLILATEFIDLIPSTPCVFKRAVSVKLPLPTGVEVEEENDDIAVLQKTENGWELVDSKYKFTRTTVTFDTKSLTKFCVMQSKPDRKKRLPPAAQVLENRNNREKGEIVAFLNLQEKLWFLVLECMPLSKLDGRVKERSEKGFKHVVKEIVKKDEGTNFFRRPQKFQQPTRQLQVPPTCEINDGMKWEFSVVDDIKVNSESNYMENRELHYFRYLPESYRQFVIEPKTNEERAISGAINLDPLGIEDKNLKENCTCSIHIEIDEETVKAYFKPEFVPEEPEPKKEKVNFDILNTPVFKENKPEVPVIQKFKPLPPTVMERLMRTNRKPIIIERESKVLSGKSLRNLSKLVPEGLTLAVHLNLPDSTITGLGFDAISNGLSMADVTYKILLYWKRMCKDKKDGAVNSLTNALRDMGREEIANIVFERHRDNKELSPDAFTPLFTPYQ